MGDLEHLAGRVSAAGDALADLATTYPAAAAALVLEHANPPRATGRLEQSGHVEVDAAVFGGGVVDYAAAVHAVDPFLDRAALEAEAAVADLFDTDVSAVLAGI